MIDESYIVKHYAASEVAQGEALSLSIVICPDSFMYAVSTQHFETVTELCHVQFADHLLPSFRLQEKIAFVIQNYGLQKKKFSKVNISVLNHEFTIVPPAFVQTANLKKLLHFTTGKTDIRHGLHKHIKNLDFCYTIDHELLGYLEKTFSNATISHNGAVSISSFFGQHSLKANDMFLSLYSSHIELIVKQGSDLLFYNVFRYQNNEDILYYLLFTMEQFSLNPLYVKLVIASQTGISDELVSNLKKYIKQVSFCVNDASIKMNGDLKSLPGHYYFNLLNQHLCEL